MAKYYTPVHRARLRFSELKKNTAPLSPAAINGMAEEIENLLGQEREDLSALDPARVKSKWLMREELDAAKRSAHLGSAIAKFEDLERFSGAKAFYDPADFDPEAELVAYDTSTIHIIKDEIHEHLQYARKDASALDSFLMRTKQEMENQLDELAQDAHVYSARMLFRQLETTEEKLPTDSVSRIVSGIDEHLREGKSGFAILDYTGTSTSREMQDRIALNAQRIKDLSDPVKVMRKQWAAAVAGGDTPKIQELIKADKDIVDVPVNGEGETAIDVMRALKFDADKNISTEDGRKLAHKFATALGLLKSAGARTGAEVRRDLQKQALKS
jgi:hypothetical protein